MFFKVGLGAQTDVSGFNLELPPLVGPEHSVVPIFLGSCFFSFLLHFLDAAELVGSIFNQRDNVFEVFEVGGNDVSNN